MKTFIISISMLFAFCFIAETYATELQSTNSQRAKPVKKTSQKTNKVAKQNNVKKTSNKPIASTSSAPTTGTATANINGEQVNVRWIQLWKDGPKWAEFNISSTKDNAYGGYYCWGNTKSKDSQQKFSKVESDIQGTSLDMATQIWGENWKLPTRADMSKLISQCDIQYIEPNSEYPAGGILVTGRGIYSKNTVYFPYAGDFFDRQVNAIGVYGKYWTSTPMEKDADFPNYSTLNSYSLYIERRHTLLNRSSRNYGFSIRAILK